MNLPDIARDYDARGSAAAFSVLIELGQVLGAYRQKFVIVGGAVPWLLMPNVRPSHIGTLDVDLNLSPEALSAGEYATLIESLETAGYERGVDDLKGLCAHRPRQEERCLRHLFLGKEFRWRADWAGGGLQGIAGGRIRDDGVPEHCRQVSA